MLIQNRMNGNLVQGSQFKCNADNTRRCNYESLVALHLLITKELLGGQDQSRLQCQIIIIMTHTKSITHLQTTMHQAICLIVIVCRMLVSFYCEYECYYGFVNNFVCAQKGNNSSKTWEFSSSCFSSQWFGWRNDNDVIQPATSVP